MMVVARDGVEAANCPPAQRGTRRTMTAWQKELPVDLAGPGTRARLQDSWEGAAMSVAGNAAQRSKLSHDSSSAARNPKLLRGDFEGAERAQGSVERVLSELGSKSLRALPVRRAGAPNSVAKRLASCWVFASSSIDTWTRHAPLAKSGVCGTGPAELAN